MVKFPTTLKISDLPRSKSDVLFCSSWRSLRKSNISTGVSGLCKLFTPGDVTDDRSASELMGERLSITGLSGTRKKVERVAANDYSSAKTGFFMRDHDQSGIKAKQK